MDIESRVEGETLIITVGEESLEIPLFLVQGWDYEQADNR